MRTFGFLNLFKVFLEFVTILLLFYVLVLLAERQVGSSPTGAGTHPRAGK